MDPRRVDDTGRATDYCIAIIMHVMLAIAGKAGTACHVGIFGDNLRVSCE
jgi:hypothetical protein